MATKFEAALMPNQSNDVEFRAWCTFIHDVFTLSGAWTNTADTGQIDLATVPRPTAANMSRGYKIYAMADALQAAKPVFVKVEFGSGSSVNYPGSWLTIGTGTDGAGNITGALLARTLITTGASASTGMAAYGSADSGRVGIALFLGGATYAMAVFLERTKDAAGDDDGTGLLLSWSYQGTNHRTLYLPFSGSIPVAETCYQALVSTNNPSAMGNDVGAGLVSHFYGVAQQPGINNVVVNSNDFADYAQFTVTVYGDTATYQHLGSNLTTVNGRATTRLAMLYQ
jgi:hypothetical protein